VDYYPRRCAQIDQINERVYDAVNNGVYKSGFATTQEAYEEAVTELFKALDELEDPPSSNPPIWSAIGSPKPTGGCSPRLVRFDPVYVGHFKCNIRRIADYPNLQGYLRELYQWPGVAETVSMDHIKRHYYMSHETVNPTRIVPVGPGRASEADQGSRCCLLPASHDPAQCAWFRPVRPRHQANASLAYRNGGSERHGPDHQSQGPAHPASCPGSCATRDAEQNVQAVWAFRTPARFKLGSSYNGCVGYDNCRASNHPPP
jgi:hypothetical protein